MIIKNFDALRLVFAAMVVFFHIGILAGNDALAWLTVISATFAVQAFFFVSGFLVTMSYERSSNLKSYALKRVRRIFPAYFVVVIASAVTLSVLSSLSFSEYYRSAEFWRYIFYNMALSNFSAPSLPGVFGGNVENAVNASLWTIKIEVAFYCFVPFIVYGIKRWGYEKVLVTLFVLSLCWRFGLEGLGQYYGSGFLSKLAKQLPGQIAFFATGMFAYYRTKERKRSPNFLLFLISLVVYFAAEGWLFTLCAPICVGIAVYWLAISAPKLWSPATYGDFSYGIYLFHFPLVQALVALGWFATSPYYTLLVAVAAIVIIAILSWYFIEKPFIEAKKSGV